jgi:predicted O-linked N-acetylglucosamine transferase (SPINDLY family)
MFHGIHPKRVIFVPHLNMVDYRRLLGLSDLFLDTIHYNAHTVATDAMSEGLPVLTLTGTRIIISHNILFVK